MVLPRNARSPLDEGWQGDGADHEADGSEVQRAHVRAEKHGRHDGAERRGQAAQQAHAADGQVAHGVVRQDVDAGRHHEDDREIYP